MKTTLIKQVLEETDVTQSELARSAGFSEAYINRVVNGKVEPGIRNALRIARALKCDVERIFELEEAA